MTIRYLINDDSAPFDSGELEKLKAISSSVSFIMLLVIEDDEQVLYED
jgi:hypothetical protein